MNTKLLVITAILLILGGLFYWFQYRPSEIRKKCVVVAQEYKGGVFEKYGIYDPRGIGVANKAYNDCIVGKGLTPEKLYNWESK